MTEKKEATASKAAGLRQPSSCPYFSKGPKWNIMFNVQIKSEDAVWFIEKLGESISAEGARSPGVQL